MLKSLGYARYVFVQRLRDMAHRYIDDFMFVHIHKTAGISIEHALGLPLAHKTALERIKEVGSRRWEAKYTFAFVRNPWDRVVSQYHHRVWTKQTNLGTNPIEFKEWVELSYGRQDPLYIEEYKYFMPQLDWISDSEGRILVQDIYHFENLKDDFEHVCSKLGKSAELPHINATKHRDYREYYDERTKRIVADWFAKDIVKFGYQFNV